MCPEQQLISIYLDGELPSPWKEKMQNHFSQCSSCKEKLVNFERLHNLFVNDEVSSQAKERVWEKLESNQSNFSGQRGFSSQGSFHTYRPRYNVLRQRISIPLPAAAAAAVVIILLAVFWLRLGSPLQRDTTDKANNFILASEFEEIPGIIPAAADMNGVFQYLTPSGNGANIIILQLPESQSFFRAGEPEIVRAADFSRR